MKYLEEGTKELYQQYVDTKKVSKDVFDLFLKEDPSKSKKYIQWMLKQYLQNPNRQRHIVDVVKAFDNLVNRKIVQKEESDIYKYDLDLADDLIQNRSNVQSKGEIKKQAKEEGSEIIQETNNHLIVKLKSHTASCFYGANTKWCISGKTSNYWNQYWEAGITIYVVIDKIRNKKYAVAVGPDGTKECFDEEDNAMSYDDVKRLVGVK